MSGQGLVRRLGGYGWLRPGQSGRLPRRRSLALQCTDVCESKSMPYNDFLDFYYDGWIETLDWVAQPDVDIIDVGHHSPATKADEVTLRAYLVDLHRQVLDLVRAGQSWDQLYRNIRFSEEVKRWIAFDRFC